MLGAWSVMHTLRPRDAALRPLPYPYLGALALSQDADFCSMDVFEELMRFVNTDKRTAFGDGLGLEMSSSLFFYSPRGRQFAYFDGLAVSAPPSPHAPRLDEYLRSGWIDTNHSYGDFDGAGGFIRAHAERALERLESMGVRLPIYSNHGDDRNAQCLGEEARHHQGDVKDSAAYHADLLVKGGAGFFTSSVYISGDTACDGHARPLSEVRRGRWLDGSAFSREAPLLRPLVLRDGSRFLAFMRLRGTAFNAPNLSSLAYQFQSISLERLYRQRAAVVLYQHLGVLHRSASRCRPATIDAIRASPHLLTPFRLMKKENEEDRLWVPTLQRLLTYAEMIGEVRVRPHDGFEIDSESLAGDPRQYFAGLTLYCHPKAEPRLRCRGTDLPLRLNGPDETGQYSVTVPFPPLPDLW